jgi:hypothetical protein
VKRRLSNAAAGFSLFLFVALAGLWIRGLFYYDLIIIETSREDGTHAEVWVYQISPGGGVFWMHRNYRRWPFRSKEDREAFIAGRANRPVVAHHPTKAKTWWYGSTATDLPQRFGFYYDRKKYFDSPQLINHGRTLAAPLWLPLILCGLWPAWWYARRRRELRRDRRTAGGLCAVCGYDLRGTSGSYCPECGATSEGQR